MINASNIVDYVNFLYQRKYGKSAPKDLLDSWSGLTDSEAQQNLLKLYEYWQLDPVGIQGFERDFLAKGTGQRTSGPIFPDPAPSHNPSPVPPNYPEPYQEPRHSGRTGFIVLLILLGVGAAGYFIWQARQTDGNPPSEVVASDTDNQKVDTKPVQPEGVEVKPAPPEVTADDEDNAAVIKTLFRAEDDRDFDRIQSFFDPNMERYWNINYPTYDELKSAYEKSWQNTLESTNTDINIQKVDDLTYDVSNTFTYTLAKDGTQKTKKGTVRFVFTPDHKITQIYGLD